MIVDEVHTFTDEELERLAAKIKEIFIDLVTSYYSTTVQRHVLGWPIS